MQKQLQNSTRLDLNCKNYCEDDDGDEFITSAATLPGRPQASRPL
jgi:hypothetical protein